MLILNRKNHKLWAVVEKDDKDGKYYIVYEQIQIGINKLPALFIKRKHARLFMSAAKREDPHYSKKLKLVKVSDTMIYF